MDPLDYPIPSTERPNPYAHLLEYLGLLFAAVALLFLLLGTAFLPGEGTFISCGGCFFANMAAWLVLLLLGNKPHPHSPIRRLTRGLAIAFWPLLAIILLTLLSFGPLGSA